MDKSKTKIWPHYLLMKEYLKIVKKEENLLDFYYKSLESFDKKFFNSHQTFGEFINENDKSLFGRYIYIIMQTKNALDSFFGHYFILKNGLCNASIPNLRFCYETLLKNYFYLVLPLGEKDLVKYHKTWPEKIRNKLYTVKSLEESHQKLYRMLSIKSHAGIVSSSPSYECSSETYKDSLETGIYLLHGYFVFLLECFNQFISTKDREQIKKFFGEFEKRFGVIPSFIPDKENVSHLLKFQNINLVTPSNVEEFKRNKKEYLDNS
ncbi:hypothetical protein GOV12_06780 [Candidatus Pacearchaeota archaeon]|nr:hypothetical protein [Candidatus Pacearchaeota archaeon]